MVSISVGVSPLCFPVADRLVSCLLFELLLFCFISSLISLISLKVVFMQPGGGGRGVIYIILLCIDLNRGWCVYFGVLNIEISLKNVRLCRM